MEQFTSFYRDTPRELVDLPTGLTFPVKYAIIRRKVVNNTFGMVRRNSDGSKRPHQGWDFYAPPRYRCYAIADGEIAAIRTRGAYGKQIILHFTHDLMDDGVQDTLYAAYCHLDAIHVAVGQQVSKGEHIGHCGDSGNASGMIGTDAHLHFEIRTHLNVGRGLSRRISPLAVFGEYPIRTIMVTDPALL
ncbi:M23 family metallopeptidase [Erythrobacter litoralis]|uniref:Putative secreted protein n=1 Tax=Erythrobacter litoralis (strain HTCC2594) TaxID=314225 RepID=Q2N7M7_ERYLH|nr:M23 family metallopeptidase [Erythrobacter litoralis]ABC64314.1 putative secreted protein [Erythrobacter litoralis HTCC2594]